MFKTMTDELYRERLMTRLEAMEEVINHNVLRDFDVWVVLKNDKDMVISTLSLDVYSPSKMYSVILHHSNDGSLDSLSIVFYRKHAGASTFRSVAHFDVMKLCNCYDYKEVLKYQIKSCLDKCNHKFYGV